MADIPLPNAQEKEKHNSGNPQVTSEDAQKPPKAPKRASSKNRYTLYIYHFIRTAYRMPKESGKHTLYISNSVPFIEDPTLTTKDIYRNYWRCRDLEINSGWKHFIFLAVLLVLCFTFYGTLAGGLIDSLKNAIHVTDAYWYVVHGIFLLLCIVGNILSCLWIMMAKGSQARCKKYENAIIAFEGKSLKEKESYGEISYESLHPAAMGEKYIQPTMDCKLYTGNVGAFSVTKINWAIGFLTLIVWSLLMIVHAALIGWKLDGISGILIGVIITCILVCVLPYMLKSCKRLTEQKKQKE